MCRSIHRQLSRCNVAASVLQCTDPCPSRKWVRVCKVSLQQPSPTTQCAALLVYLCPCLFRWTKHEVVEQGRHAAELQHSHLLTMEWRISSVYFKCYSRVKGLKAEINNKEPSQILKHINRLFFVYLKHGKTQDIRHFWRNWSLRNRKIERN